MSSFEEAFGKLSQKAQEQIKEVAAFAVLQEHLKDRKSPADLETVMMVSHALAITYDGNEHKIDDHYQSVMSSRLALEQSDKILLA